MRPVPVLTRFISSIFAMSFWGGANQCSAEFPQTPTYTITYPLGETSSPGIGLGIAGDSSRLFIGGPNVPTGRSHSGIVFQHELSDGSPSRSIEPDVPMTFARFGSAVSFDAPYLIVGAPDHGGGRVQMFDVNTSGNPLDSPVLDLHKSVPVEHDGFGFPLTFADSRIAVGVPGDDTAADDAGAVHVFENTGALAYPPLYSPNPFTREGFARSIVACNGVIAVATEFRKVNGTLVNSGSVYLISVQSGAVQRTLVSPANEEDLFGFSLAAVGDDLLAVGAPWSIHPDTGADRSGAIHIFKVSTGQLIQTIVDPDGRPNQSFGRRSLAGLTDGGIFVGHHGRRKAYLFDAESGAIRQVFDDPDEDSDSEYGWTVATVDDNLLVAKRSGVHVYLRGGPSPQPPFNPEVDFPAGGNLVLITHGWLGPLGTEESRRKDTKDWVREMIEGIEARINARPDRDTWHVRPYFWLADADTEAVGNLDEVAGQNLALSRGSDHGTRLGERLSTKSYESIHFIGYSAGAGLLTRATQEIVARSGTASPRIHSTYLDAYAPSADSDEHIAFDYGDGSEWAEHYFSGGLIDSTGTNVALRLAHNVRLDKLGRIECGVEVAGKYSNHQAPREFYRDTICSPDQPEFKGPNGIQYGFQLSIEGRSDDWNPTGDSRLYPYGQPVVFLGTGPAVEPVPGSTPIPPAPFNFADTLHDIRRAGEVLASANNLDLATSSPAWYEANFEWETPLEFVLFDREFTSGTGAEGVLAMYIDGLLIARIDERWIRPGRHSDVRYFGQLPPGTHTLAFRLDPYSDVPSEVTISNLRFGYSVRAPEFLTNFTAGPDRNEDGLPDAVVEVSGRENSEYTFRLDFYQPDLPPALVRDVVPSDWEVVSCVPENPLDLVLVGPTGQGGHKGYRATEIQWFPTDNDGSLECTIRLRRHSNQHFEPHQCGALFLNEGAAALDSSTGQPLLDENGSPLRGRRIFVAAVTDRGRHRDGSIDWSGAGDEDGDGLLDYDECELGTNPCDPDTDGDGIPDGEDPAPLEESHR